MLVVILILNFLFRISTNTNANPKIKNSGLKLIAIFSVISKVKLIPRSILILALMIDVIVSSIHVNVVINHHLEITFDSKANH